MLFEPKPWKQAPLIPGPRREGVSPPCRAHSAHALIHFPISTPQAPPNKP